MFRVGDIVKEKAHSPLYKVTNIKKDSVEIYSIANKQDYGWYTPRMFTIFKSAGIKSIVQQRLTEGKEDA